MQWLIILTAHFTTPYISSGSKGAAMFEEIVEKLMPSALDFVKQEYPEESPEIQEAHARALIAFKCLMYALKTGDTTCIE